MRRKSSKKGMYILFNSSLFTNNIKIDLTQFTNSLARTKKVKSHHKKMVTTVENDITDVQADQKHIFEEAVQDFESKCHSLSQFYCESCKMTGIAIKQSQINKKLCTTCHRSKLNQEDMDKYLPVWYDKKGKVQYQLPIQQQGLREDEMFMLQQVSPYVPLIHLKDGQIGSRGHVCSFVQEISEICTILPRLPDDIQFVKVVKQYHKEGGDIGSKTFTIRKKAVLDALK